MSHAIPRRRTIGASSEHELAFSLVLWKKGFVAFPRLLLHYAAEALLDYESIGMLLHLLFLLQDDDSMTGEYQIRAEDGNEERFSAIQNLAVALDERELILIEEMREGEICLSFRPLYAKLRAVWLADQQHREALLQETVISPAEKMARNQELLRDTEQRFGRPLAAREIDILIDWVEELGLGHEAVEVMLDEAAERGRLRFDYVNAIARDWAQRGVRTKEDAEAARSRYREAMARHDRIVRYLGLGRRLTAAEEGLLAKWTTEWGFPDDVVLKACDQTVNIKDPNFRYIDAVLEGWKALGVRTVADAEAALNDHKGRRAPVPASQGRKPAGAARSNVFLPVEKKDRAHYEEFFDKPRKR